MRRFDIPRVRRKARLGYPLFALLLVRPWRTLPLPRPGPPSPHPGWRVSCCAAGEPERPGADLRLGACRIIQLFYLLNVFICQGL